MYSIWMDGWQKNPTRGGKVSMGEKAGGCAKIEGSCGGEEEAEEEEKTEVWLFGSCLSAPLNEKRPAASVV